jgi:membrane-associated phospholipid phosphatase
LADRAGQAAVLAVIMFSSLGLYLLVLRWRGAAARWQTYTSWDDLVPFRPEWVWVYLLPYLIGPVAMGLVSRTTFRWFVARGLTVIGLSLLIFIIWPTQTAARPPLPSGADGLTYDLYREMAAADEPPANAAPSLHVSLTLLVAWALVRDFPRWWPVTAFAIGLVWLSTLFTRQHHLIDVVTGALLCCLVVLGWGLLSKRRGEWT